MMSIKNCIRTFEVSINLFEMTLGDKTPTPEFIVEFQKNQMEFYRQLTALTSGIVQVLGDTYRILNPQVLGDICNSLKDVIERTRKIESKILHALEKKNDSVLVKVLGSIANTLRYGEEKKALEEFKRCFPDGEGSVAREVFKALCKVKKRSEYDDFGRLCFYNSNPEWVSTPFQKACAVELAMVGVVCNAFEKGGIEQAHAEFNALPYRMKEPIFLLLAENDVELGRTRFSSYVETHAKIECLTTFQNNLEKIYSEASENDRIRILQQDFKAALERNEETNNPNPQAEMIELLRTTHLTAFQALEILQRKLNALEAVNRILLDRNIQIISNEDTRYKEISRLQIENLQLKLELNEILNKRAKEEYSSSSEKYSS